MNEEANLLNFINHRLPYQVMEGVDALLRDKDIDPETAWSDFRRGLRMLKKEHVELYLAYLESDDEAPPPESTISKWRRENQNHGK